MTQSPSSSTHWPSRRERILSLAGRLSADLDAIDLDDVDGEFYWRICRDDLLEPLAQLAASFTPNTLEGRTSYDQVFRDLQIDKMQLARFIQSARPIRDKMPRHVWSRLVFPDPVLDQRSWIDSRRAVSPVPIPLRPLSFDLDGERSVLQIRVASRVWSGADLEAELDWRRDALPFWFAPNSTPKVVRRGEFEWRHNVPQAGFAPDPTGKVSLRMEFALVREPPPSASSPHPVPFIEITLSYPLPPPDYLGPAYDTYLRNQPQLELLLPGKATNQEIKTAIWTWAIGLLIAVGEDFYEARWAVEERTSLDLKKSPPGRTWFEKSRAKLIERVPEAKDYLYRRRRRSTAETTP
jgi:hypothetical protein